MNNKKWMERHVFMYLGWLALLVFMAMAFLDFVFALYILEVAAKHSLKAAIMAGIIQITQAFVITSYVRDRRLIIPVVLGAAFGTYLLIEYFAQ